MDVGQSKKKYELWKFIKCKIKKYVKSLFNNWKVLRVNWFKWVTTRKPKLIKHINIHCTSFLIMFKRKLLTSFRSSSAASVTSTASRDRFVLFRFTRLARTVGNLRRVGRRLKPGIWYRRFWRRWRSKFWLGWTFGVGSVGAAPSTAAARATCST
jgi:hypothetical protein